MARGKRMYKRKRSGKKINKKAITKIVKAVIGKQVETKFFYGSFDAQGIKVASPVSWNIFSTAVSRGTSDNQMIGDKLLWKGITFKYSFINAYLDTSYIYTNWPTNVHVMLIESDVYKAATNLTYSEIWTVVTGNPETDFITNGVRVLAHNVHKVRPDAAASPVPRHNYNGVLKYYPKKPRMLQYKDSSLTSKELVGKNYYLVYFCVSQSTGVGGVNATVSGNWRNYFKDS